MRFGGKSLGLGRGLMWFSLCSLPASPSILPGGCCISFLSCLHLKPGRGQPEFPCQRGFAGPGADAQVGKGKLHVPPPLSSRRLIRLTVEYDGTDYCGWQSQIRRDDGPFSEPEEVIKEDFNQSAEKLFPRKKFKYQAVQDVLETAIWRLTGEVLRTRSSSRTDAGVHALGQVTVFSTRTPLQDAEVLRGLNTRLPKDVAIRTAETVKEDFDPRKCTNKLYRYTIATGCTRPVMGRKLCWFVKDNIDIGLMRDAASYLVGRRMNFASFASSQASEEGEDLHCLIDEISITSESSVGLHEDLGKLAPNDTEQQGCGREYIIIEVRGKRFLHKMVRIIVGTLVEVGKGNVAPESMPSIVDASDRQACKASTAPSCGLSLVWVKY